MVNASHSGARRAARCGPYSSEFMRRGVFIKKKCVLQRTNTRLSHAPRPLVHSLSLSTMAICICGMSTYVAHVFFVRDVVLLCVHPPVCIYERRCCRRTSMSMVLVDTTRLQQTHTELDNDDTGGKRGHNPTTQHPSQRIIFTHARISRCCCCVPCGCDGMALEEDTPTHRHTPERDTCHQQTKQHTIHPPKNPTPNPPQARASKRERESASKQDRKTRRKRQTCKTTQKTASSSLL